MWILSDFMAGESARLLCHRDHCVFFMWQWDDLVWTFAWPTWSIVSAIDQPAIQLASRPASQPTSVKTFSADSVFFLKL